ncbi:hypothetical protein FLONG3_10826 [Fusarium longipes]|uniref:IBR domain-containing protein n=1 Tax=Fusarium longipes TaxID=694270 RepID=A0A395RKB5_9HYPO|nr:hypothetical protein FLONG3_10826 [Fusarium longipes]
MDNSLILAVSIAQAVEADAELIEQLRQEDQIARDAMLAKAIESDPLASFQSAPDQLSLDNEMLNTLRPFNVMPTAKGDGNMEDGDIFGGWDIDSEATVQSSTEEATTDLDHVNTKQCVACQDDFPDTQTFEASCSHYWCQACLVRRIEDSIKNESLFPPACCLPFPIKTGKFISQDMFDRYQEKSIEFETTDRTYCRDAACSAFILPQSIEGGIGRCPQCDEQTCALCKKDPHEDVCPQDSTAQAVLRLAEAEGWRRCGKCNHLIELNTGCYHIRLLPASLLNMLILLYKQHATTLFIVEYVAGTNVKGVKKRIMHLSFVAGIVKWIYAIRVATNSENSDKVLSE